MTRCRKNTRKTQSFRGGRERGRKTSQLYTQTYSRTLEHKVISSLDAALEIINPNLALKGLKNLATESYGNTGQQKSFLCTYQIGYLIG